jgi:hypothetical protein
MSGERHDAELSEYMPLAEIDDELKAALSVSPSPDFEARVLRRIADRRTARSPRWKVFAPLAAAALVVIATTLVVQGPHQRSDMPSNGPSRSASPQWAPPGPDPQVAVPPAAPVSPPAATQFAERSRRIVPHPPDRQASAGAAPEPAVIVPPEQAEAIRRLVRAIAEGRLDPPAMPETRVTGAPMPVPVQPLTIQPILVSAAEDRGGPAPVVRPQ